MLPDVGWRAHRPPLHGEDDVALTEPGRLGLGRPADDAERGQVEVEDFANVIGPVEHFLHAISGVTDPVGSGQQEENGQAERRGAWEAWRGGDRHQVEFYGARPPWVLEGRRQPGGTVLATATRRMELVPAATTSSRRSLA